MKFTKRFFRLQEKVDRFFEKCLHRLTARDTTTRKLQKRQIIAPAKVETVAEGSDASRVDSTPGLGIENVSQDMFGAAVNDPDDAGCNVSDADPYDTSSNSSSEDSWYMETPPLNLNYDALNHVATHFLPGSHGACIDISTLQRATFHEIRVLHFEDGWTCIGPFTREAEPLAKMESELATLEYVHKHTSIPVPEVYLVSHSDNDYVGAPFVLMEHMRGSPLEDIWEDLSLEHKLDAIKQLAGIIDWDWSYTGLLAFPN